MEKKINYKELEKHINTVFQKLMEEDDLKELVKPVLKSKNNKMENKNDRGVKAIDIVKEYIPLFYNSQNYKWNVLSVIDENSKWTNDLIEFVEKHKDNRRLIVQTIMHDIGGLMREDEHFVPRI